MNFYSGDAFLKALAETAFPSKRAGVGLFETAGNVYRLLEVDGQPLTHWPFLDLVEPYWARSGVDGARPVKWVPWALRRTVSAQAWRERPDPDCQPCPFIDWRLFPTWADFERRLPRRGNVARLRKGLERNVGPLRFVEDDRDPEVFAACLRWKSRQYRETGLEDLFAEPKNVELFRSLQRRGATLVSSLYAGPRLAAAHLGFRYRGRFGYWIPSHDPELAKHGGGTLLLRWLLEQSHRCGDQEFDFLIGDEPYKYEYATHVRVAGPVGKVPLPVIARRRVKRALDALPWLGRPVRALLVKMRRAR